MDVKPIQCFPFSANTHSRILILGSMPSVQSLKVQEYYAHPRNAFWTMMETLFQIPRHDPYLDRLRQLRACRIALWDSASRCHRQGSLDSRMTHIIPNDFTALFRISTKIEAFLFNGQKSYDIFRLHVLKKSPQTFKQIKLITLPSSSPAYAAMSVRKKTTKWKRVLKTLPTIGMV